MRAVLLVVTALSLAGCPRPGDGECLEDTECDGLVCGRDGGCWAASEIQEIKVTWTLSGEPASEATCAGHEDLFIRFEGPSPGQTLGYAPVPCFTGQFLIDKLPRSYDTIELGADRGPSELAPITGATVAFDLPL